MSTSVTCVSSEPGAPRTIKSQFIFPCVNRERLIVGDREGVRQQVPFALNESTCQCEKYSLSLVPFYFHFFSRHHICTQIRDLFLSRSQWHTHTRPFSSLSLSFSLQFVINGTPAAARLIHCTQSEGRPGQVIEVALDWAIFLSLPKVPECMADKSALWSSLHLLWMGSQRHKFVPFTHTTAWGIDLIRGNKVRSVICLILHHTLQC